MGILDQLRAAQAKREHQSESGTANNSTEQATSGKETVKVSASVAEKFKARAADPELTQTYTREEIDAAANSSGSGVASHEEVNDDQASANTEETAPAAPEPEEKPSVRGDTEQPSDAVSERALSVPVRKPLTAPVRRPASTAGLNPPVSRQPDSAPASGGTGRGLRPVGRRIIPSTPQPDDELAAAFAEPEVISDENATAPAIPETLPKTSVLAGIKARAQNRINGSPVTVNEAALEAVEMGNVCNAEEMLAELQNIEMQAGEETDDALNTMRAEVLTKGANRIEQIFSEELAGLAIEQASDFAIREMSHIVKLTFMRVKASPIAWDLMEHENKASVIKAMRAMANKRNHAVKTRASGKKGAAELSKSLDTLTSSEALPDEAMDMLGDFGFNLG